MPELDVTASTQPTAAEVLAVHDFTGRHVAITGASGGIGLELALALAGRGASLTMLGRPGDKLDAAVVAVADAAAAPPRVIEIDLSSLADVARAGSELADGPTIDLLVNNAGVMATPLDWTVDGHERQMGTNHLGHFLLTLLAQDTFAENNARVVNVSSAGHRFGGVDLDDPAWRERPYDAWAAYGQSKTANILFTRELERRWSSAGVHSVAVHPGRVSTELGRHLTDETMTQIIERMQAARAASQDDGTASTDMLAPAQGAGCVATACVAGPAAHGGYFDETRLSAPLAHAADDEIAAQLWDWSLSQVDAHR